MGAETWPQGNGRAGDVPTWAATRPVDGWESLSEQSATLAGFGLTQLAAAFSSGRVPLP